MIGIRMEVRHLSMLLFVPCQQGKFLAYMDGGIAPFCRREASDGERGTRALTPLLHAPQWHRKISAGLVRIRFVFENLASATPRGVTFFPVPR